MFGKLTVSINRHWCMQCIGHIYKYNTLYYARLWQSQVPYAPDRSPCSSCLCQDEAESSTWLALTTRVCAKLRQIQVPDRPGPQSLFFMSVPGWGRFKYLIAPDHHSPCSSYLCQAEAESHAHSFQISHCSSPLCWPQPLHLIPGKAVINCLSYLALIAVISLDRNILQQQEDFVRTQ